MPDHPIIFSARMVRALLDGRKTQTRRLAWRNEGDPDPQATPHPATWQLVKPGDRLWVRENWRVGAWRRVDGALLLGQIAVDYQASPEENRTPWLDVPDPMWKTFVDQSCADARRAVQEGRGSIRALGDGWKWDHGDSPCRWRPSIHMPRWASRITLHVEAVRVERLRAISDADAAAEGVTPCALSEPVGMAAFRFRELWDGLHGTDSWDSNPEVVVLTFRALAVEGANDV